MDIKGSSTVATSPQKATSTTTSKNPYWVLSRGPCARHTDHGACVVVKLEDQPCEGQYDLVFKFVGAASSGLGNQAIKVMADLLAECEHHTDPQGFCVTDGGKMLHVHYDTNDQDALFAASNRLKVRLDRVIAERRMQYWRDPRTGYFHPHHITPAMVNASWDL